MDAKRGDFYGATTRFITAEKENKVCRCKRRSTVSNKPPAHEMSNFMEFSLNLALKRMHPDAGVNVYHQHGGVDS